VRQVTPRGPGVRYSPVMTELVLVFCLMSSPTSCREERPLLADLSPMGCMVQGQIAAQEWLADHPKWSFKGWRCERNLPRQRAS
jgi:hypothetical protein